MYILGISCYYHDAAAALLKDGGLVAGAQEERFTRRKHDASFPEKAIRFCLEEEGIGIDQIDYVAFYEKPLVKFERILHQHLQTFPKSMKTFLQGMPSWMTEKVGIRRTLRKKLGFLGNVLFIQHHLAHAASAFLVSPFEEAAILTIDGVGEWTTTAYGHGRGSEITLENEIQFPHSLGLLYSTITAYLGFKVNNDEYKVMGLAAYGEQDPQRNELYGKLREVIDINPDGSFRLDMQYFKYHYSDRMPADELINLLGEKIRGKGEPLSQHHKDVAAALQLITEGVIMEILSELHKRTGIDDLVMAGGVALNSVANGKILDNTPFKRVWIQPDAGDGGTSLGAASFVHHAILENPRAYKLEHAYYGPGYSSEEIQSFLDGGKIPYKHYESQDALIADTAKRIAHDQIVGWFQGRMEWGPRALGARSILANPCNPDMKDILNRKVKHREGFRPFAPAVCVDDVRTYFHCPKPVPTPTEFMLMVLPVKKRWQKRIPSVTHVDGTARVQVVRRATNPNYYDLIKAVGERSGIPIIINTSFNVKGEPIVCSPQDAYHCMIGTGIDVVVLGEFLVEKEA